MRLAELVLLLLEVVVGTAEEGCHILELAIEIVPVLSVSDLDMHEQAISHQVKFVAKSFDEDAAMAFGLINPLIDFIKPPIYSTESLIDFIKPSIQSTKSLIDFIEPLIHFTVSPIDFTEPVIQLRIHFIEPVIHIIEWAVEVLNQFLIHATSPRAKE